MLRSSRDSRNTAGRSRPTSPGPVYKHRALSFGKLFPLHQRILYLRNTCRKNIYMKISTWNCIKTVGREHLWKRYMGKWAVRSRPISQDRAYKHRAPSSGRLFPLHPRIRCHHNTCRKGFTKKFYKHSRDHLLTTTWIGNRPPNDSIFQDQVYKHRAPSSKRNIRKMLRSIY